MAIVKALYGHDSFETAYTVQDYPYGRQRCVMYFWLETKPSKGVRLVTQSTNPKNGRLNKPHPGIYSLITANMYLDENEHCQWTTVNEYHEPQIVIDFIRNFPDNHRMDVLKVWCLKKYQYELWCVENKRSRISESSASEADVERWTKAKDLWWKAYLLAARKPEDSAQPELKKKETV